MLFPPLEISQPELITTMVSGQIAKADQMVNSTFLQASNALNLLAGKQFSIDWTEPVWSGVSPGGVDSINPDEPSPPAIQDISGAYAVFDGATPVVPTITIDQREIPEFVEQDFGFSIPAPPDVSWPTFSREVPSPSDIPVPTAPDLNLPPVPTLASISIPSPPEYSIPEFDGTPPIDDLTVPTTNFSFAEDRYSSRNNSLIADKLFDNISNGGTGLDEATEQAIYNRATSRQEEEEQALMDNISVGFASRGFPLPPGALVSATLEAENKILRSREDLNNDILVQQSKLAQENTHFMLERGIQFEQIMITYHNEVQNRALESEKFVVTTAINVYGLRVESYKAKLQAYAVLAEIYKTRIEGEIAKAEFYKAQIEGVKASAIVQQAIVEVYRAQVEAVKALMESYRIQMEGARIHAEIDKTKIEGFLAEVNTYVARVNAETAKYEGYKAQIAGEAAKAEMYKTSAEAYVAKVTGFKAVAETDIARAEAQLVGVRSQTEVFKALIDKYTADVQKSIAAAEIKAKQQGLEIDIFRAETAKYSSELETLVRVYLGKIEEVKAKADISVKNAEIAVRASLGQYELAVEAAKGVAQVAGQMAAGAASSVNASIHAASSENRSDSRSYSVGLSSSNSDSTSISQITQHIYEHSDG